jgi:HicA toxin of bacterial toxin-antitoxin,
MIALITISAIMIQVNNKHRRTLEAVWTDPVNGNIKWLRIELLLIALGCRVVEGPGSSVTFEWQGRRATFHRPHPGKEALRYRVKATREFLEYMRIKP